jgi:hypothetical protein
MPTLFQGASLNSTAISQSVEAATRQRSIQTTIEAMKQQVSNETLLEITRLNLEQIEQLRREVAEIFPAENTAALVLAGLLKLKGRRLPAGVARRDLRSLLTYSAFVAAPALALSGYQKLLQLTGKDVDGAFPEGTWQFYLQFGLREDEARHANETLGFHQAVPGGASEIDMATAWLCQAIHAYFAYDCLLDNEWGERVLLRAVDQAIEEAISAEKPDLPAEQLTAARERFKQDWRIHDLPKAWLDIRPYRRDADGESYPQYRRRVFREFFDSRTAHLPDALRERIWERYHARSADELPAYQEQMSILYALTPERFYEEKVEIPLWRAKVAFVYRGRYYLLNACSCDGRGRPLIYETPAGGEGRTRPLIAPEEEGQPPLDRENEPLAVGRDGRVWRADDPAEVLGWLRPVSPAAVKFWVATIFTGLSHGVDQALPVALALAEAQRAEQRNLRATLAPETQEELKLLRQAPIILNWSLRAADWPLSAIRRAWRGIGDHAMTIFRTRRSFVFDQSHIFYDGVWGMAFAEIMTTGAIEFYGQVAGLPSQRRASHGREVVATPASLRLEGNKKFFRLAVAARVRREVAAENGRADLAGMGYLRQLLRKRNVAMTINDLLLLYRTLHDGLYRPAPELELAVAELEGEDRPFKTASDQDEALTSRQVGALIRQAWAEMAETNPSLLIPMDASYISPKERIFPTTFRSPVSDLLPLYRRGRELVLAEFVGDSPGQELAAVRNGVLERLAVFSGVLVALKEMTMRGYSFNTAVVRLLAHLPPAMQHALDLIPQKISVLNEIIKGEEVFSNTGRVAKGSSLSRFISAKDDGEAKKLVWGFLTDDRGRLHVSLRDFRRHVRPLLLNGYEDLAQAITQDYLDAYAEGLNCFVQDLIELIE